MIEAVFVDVDETLVDFDSAARRAHVEVFGDEDDCALWGELTSQFWARFNSGELDFAAMREARMLADLTHRGSAADATAAAVLEAAVGRRWEQAFECFGDVDACLGACGAGTSCSA